MPTVTDPSPTHPGEPLRSPGAAWRWRWARVASRGTGFIRTIVIASALGVGGVDNAYTVANTVPNALYDLLLGGDPVRGQSCRCWSRPRTTTTTAARRTRSGCVTIVAVVLTVIAIVAVRRSRPRDHRPTRTTPTGAERALAVTFARYFLPQLLFYGIGATSARSSTCVAASPRRCGRRCSTTWS